MNIIKLNAIDSTNSFLKEILLLISLDGFRWDYVEKFNPPHLSNFIKNNTFKGSISIIISADEETSGYGCPSVMKYLRKKGEKINLQRRQKKGRAE